MNLPEYLNFNGTQYATAKMSDEARAQIANVQMVDAEIARLQQRLAIAQTARNAYIAALSEALRDRSVANTDKPKKPRSTRSKKTSEPA